MDGLEESAHLFDVETTGSIPDSGRVLLKTLKQKEPIDALFGTGQLRVRVGQLLPSHHPYSLNTQCYYMYLPIDLLYLIPKITDEL